MLPGKGHFVPLVGKTEFNATLDEIPFLIELPKYSYTDQDGKQISIINPDETEWVIPLEGILVSEMEGLRMRCIMPGPDATTLGGIRCSATPQSACVTCQLIHWTRLRSRKS